MKKGNEAIRDFCSILVVVFLEPGMDGVVFLIDFSFCGGGMNYELRGIMHNVSSRKTKNRTGLCTILFVGVGNESVVFSKLFFVVLK